MKTISFASIFFMITIFFVTPQMSLSQELPTLLVFTSNAGPIDKTEYSLYWRNLSNSVSWRFVTALRGSDIWRVEQADCGDGSDNVWFTDRSSVYKARYDGGQITNLLPQSSPRELDLSPDLQQIVVSASGQVQSGPELIVLPSRGAGDAQITQNVSIERYPQWSPNASSVAYVIPSLQDEPLNYKLAVLDLTSGTTQIIFETGSYLSDLDWSPDGTKFLFTSDMGGDLDIYSIGVDGTGLTALTSGGDWDLNPKWSLDGSQIAFSSKRDGDGLQIFLMDADGANPTRITDASFANSDNYMQCWMRPEHHLPVAVPQVTVQSTQGDEGIVLLDGSSSYDPDGSVVDYRWSDGWQQQIAIGPTAVVSMSVGRHLVYLEVMDSQGLQGIGWLRVDVAPADSDSTVTPTALLTAPQADPAPPVSAQIPDGIIAVVRSPDGRRLAVAGTNGLFKIIDAASGAEEIVFPNLTGTTGSVAWSPDGQRIATAYVDYAGPDSVRIWDAITGTLETSTLLQYVTEVAWSPTGQYLAAANALDTSSDLYFYDASNLSEVCTTHAPRIVFDLEWHPSTDVLAAASGNGSRLIDLREGCAWNTGRAIDIPSMSIEFAPDGARIAVGSTDGQVLVYEYPGLRNIASFQQNTGYVDALAWSPDGDILASAVNGAEKWVNLLDLSSGSIVTAAVIIRGVGVGTNEIAISADGSRLYYSDGTVV